MRVRVAGRAGLFIFFVFQKRRGNPGSYAFPYISLPIRINFLENFFKSQFNFAFFQVPRVPIVLEWGK